MEELVGTWVHVWSFENVPVILGVLRQVDDNLYRVSSREMRGLRILYIESVRAIYGNNIFLGEQNTEVADVR